jgi:hypothetical protein
MEISYNLRDLLPSVEYVPSKLAYDACDVLYKENSHSVTKMYCTKKTAIQWQKYYVSKLQGILIPLKSES